MKREPSFISNFKLVIRLGVFCLCLLLIVGYFGKRYEAGAKQNAVNYFTAARYRDFYALPENTLDMAFIGSSHSYCTFDPEFIDGILGTQSFQLGTPQQHSDTTYYSLLEVFEHHNPEVIVMEVYWDVMNKPFNMEQAKAFFAVLQNERLLADYMENVFSISEKVKYAIPVIRYQEEFFAYRSSELKKMIEEKTGVYSTYVPPEGYEEYRSKGYVFCNWVLPESEYDATNQFKGLDGRDFEWNPEKKAYLQKIVDKCAEEGAKLILVTAPVAPVSMQHISHYDAIHSEFSEFAQENGLLYLDYNIINEKEKLVSNENFRDDAHLNDSGVKIIDEHFSNFLKENGIF